MATSPTWRIPTEKEVADMVEDYHRDQAVTASFDNDLWFCLDCGVPKNEDDMATWTPGLHVEATGANTGSCHDCVKEGAA